MMKDKHVLGLICSFLLMMGDKANAGPDSYEVWRGGYSPCPSFKTLSESIPEAQGVNGFHCVSDVQTTTLLERPSYKIVSTWAKSREKRGGGGVTSYEKRGFQDYVHFSSSWPIVGVFTITSKEEFPYTLNESWSKDGFSANDIFFLDKAVITYADIANEEKAQMVGPANTFSWSVLLVTEDGKNASQGQIATLSKRKQQIERLSGKRITIDWLGDMSEARGHEAGTISNMEDIRKMLVARKLNEVGAVFTHASVQEKLRPKAFEKEAFRTS